MKSEVVAWYAAIVSTAGFLLALYVALRDRASVRIHVSRNMVGFGSAYDQPKRKFVVVNVANRGRRPVTIKMVGFRLRKGKGELLLSESVRRGAVEIGEGKSHLFTVEEADFPFSDVRFAVVADQTGRTWKKRVRFAS